MENQLVELGLSKNEAKLYVTLLKLGPSLAGDITEYSGIHRRNVYDCIERLLNKGMISYVMKGNRKYFQAANPKILRSIIEKQREELEEREKQLQEIIPKLNLLEKYSREKQEVEIYRGVEGFNLIFDHVVNDRKENVVLGAHVAPKYVKLVDIYHQKRIKRKIVVKMLFNIENIERAKKFKGMPYTETRIAPIHHDSPATLNIFGNKVGIIVWSETKPLSILITNEKIADGFRTYFQELWKLGKEV